MSSPVWCAYGGIVASLSCYLLSLFRRDPVPLAWARCVLSSLGYGVVWSSNHARRPSEGLVGVTVFSLVYLVLMALVYRFYIHEPREKTSSPLH